MGATLTTIDPLLMEYYNGVTRDVLNNDVKMLKWLQKSKLSWSGRKVVFPVHFTRNGSTGARGEGGILPSAGRQGYESSYVTSAYVYSRIDLTAQSFKADKHSFAQTINGEMKGAVTDMTKELSRMSFGEGRGILGILNLSSTQGACALYSLNAFGRPGAPGGRFFEDYSHRNISVGISGAESQAGTCTVVSVALAANSGTVYDTLTCSGTLAIVSASELIYVAGASASAHEPLGLRAIIDDQTATNVYRLAAGMLNTLTFQGINRNSFPVKWNSYVDANSQTERLIGPIDLQRCFNKCEKRSGRKVELMVCEYDTLTALVDAVASDRRYNTPEFSDKWDAYSFNGLPVVVDVDAPFNELFFIGKDALKWYELCPPEWADEDGAAFKHVSNYDKFEAYLRAFVQMGTGEAGGPNSCAVLRDIKVSGL